MCECATIAVRKAVFAGVFFRRTGIDRVLWVRLPRWESNWSN